VIPEHGPGPAFAGPRESLACEAVLVSPDTAWERMLCMVLALLLGSVACLGGAVLVLALFATR